MKTRPEGVLITFEGGEGAGKSSLIHRVYQALLSEKGGGVQLTCEPGGTILGKAIRDLLLHREDFSLSRKAELFLFLADRAQHLQECILPALHQKRILLCDRFTDSTLAYQGERLGLTSQEFFWLSTYAADGLIPDLTILLDLPPEVGLRRRGKDQNRIDRESLLLHHEVRKAYLDLAVKEPQRFCVIDSSLPLERVYDEAMASIYQKIDGLM